MLPWKIMSFQSACDWSMSAILYCTMTSFRTSLPNPKFLTPAQAANVLALQNAMFWLTAAGAGPALLAAMLEGRGRIRRALACVGLASTVANHCVLGWLMGVTVVTDPNDELLVTSPNHDLLVISILSAMVFVLLAVGDVKASLALLRPPGDGEDEDEDE